MREIGFVVVHGSTWRELRDNAYQALEGMDGYTIVDYRPPGIEEGEGELVGVFVLVKDSGDGAERAR